MDWIKFEQPRDLVTAVRYVRSNVYFLENRAAQKLGLYDIRPGRPGEIKDVIGYNREASVKTHNR